MFGVKKDIEPLVFSLSDEMFAVKPIDYNDVRKEIERSTLTPTPFATLLLTI